MARHGADAVTALHQAQATIYGMMGAQAQLLAFLDDFRVLAGIFLALAPFVFVMRRPRPGSH